MSKWCEWKIDPQVKAEKVPKLILQPVVENALEHGLDVKEEGDKILQLIARASASARLPLPMRTIFFIFPSVSIRAAARKPVCGRRSLRRPGR